MSRTIPIYEREVIDLAMSCPCWIWQEDEGPWDGSLGRQGGEGEEKNDEVGGWRLEGGCDAGAWEQADDPMALSWETQVRQY